MKLRVISNRYWLVARNGRVAAQSGLGLESNPHRKGGPTWQAFNHAHAIAMEAAPAGETERLDPKGDSAGPKDIAQPDPVNKG